MKLFKMIIAMQGLALTLLQMAIFFAVIYCTFAIFYVYT